MSLPSLAEHIEAYASTISLFTGETYCTSGEQFAHPAKAIALDCNSHSLKQILIISFFIYIEGNLKTIGKNRTLSVHFRHSSEAH